MTALVRWLLFLLIGLPFQIVVYCIYPFIHIWYWFSVRPYFYRREKMKNYHHPFDLNDPKYSNIRDDSFHDNDDDHGAFSQYGLWKYSPGKALDGLTKLIAEDGSFLRQYRKGSTKSYYVSGDCVVAWCFALELSDVGHHLKSIINKACWHYLKNLGTVSHQEDANGWVSARCNNFGVNYCPDGAWSLGQPAGGPQFYTSSALFAIGYKYGSWYWKPVFWIHWLLLGGWYWMWSPVIHSTQNQLGYVRDITMKALWVHSRVFPDSLWVIQPLCYITYWMGMYENPLFYAMCGRNTSKELPAVMDCFFSQNIDGNSKQDSNAANVWIKSAVNHIRETAGFIQYE
jgi:hypothetical protein